VTFLFKEDDAALVSAVALLVTGNRFAKVLYIVTLYGQYTKVLTFENFSLCGAFI
jgi:hypothetical protein